MFRNWLLTSRELKYLLESKAVDEFTAIMQHYGIATNFIDFTTDAATAGFFAADASTKPSAGYSCIYCLNTDEFIPFANSIKTVRKNIQLGLIKPNVDNLWRLQAQKGVFIFSNYNWEVDYPMDRILFPYSGYPSYPSKDTIYPFQKSPLEQLLDQYFSLETSAFGHVEVSRLLEEIREAGGNVSYSTFSNEGFEDGCYQKAFDSPIQMLSSWYPALLKDWITYPIEEFDSTVGEYVTIDLANKTEPQEIKDRIRFAVKQVILNKYQSRQKSIGWLFSNVHDPSKVTAEFSKMVGMAWDGMRRLPYNESEIAEAMGNIFLLYAYKLNMEGVQEEIQIASKIFGESMRIELANADWSYSHGLASIEGLKHAIRKDVKELLKPDFKYKAEILPELLQIVQNPKYLFEFDAFKTLCN